MILLLHNDPSDLDPDNHDVKVQRNTQAKGENPPTYYGLIWLHLRGKQHALRMVSSGSGAYGRISAHRCVPVNTRGSCDLLQPHVFCWLTVFFKLFFKDGHLINCLKKKKTYFF